MRLEGYEGRPSYGAVMPLLRAVRTIAEEERPSLVARYRGSLDNAQSSDAGSPGEDGIGENDPRLVLRRLTREGISLAHDVDGCARFLLDAQRSCPSLRGPWRIEAAALVSLDRPSLRVLARLASLAARCSAPIEFVERGGVSIPPDGPPVLQASFAALVAKVRGRWGIAEPAVGVPQRRPARGGAAGDLGSAFRAQNYERAFAALPVKGLEAVLMRALLLVNLGAAGEAVAEVEAAIGVASGRDLASLHYLAGLLRTKNRLDPVRARGHFETGLSCTRSASVSDKMERAWLLNGAALLETLSALRAAAPERRRRLAAVLHGQQEILELSLAGNQPEMLYLRHNVLANTALLLETMGLFEEAHSFWKRSFGRALESGVGEDPPPQTWLPYFYRKGVLALKAREHAAAEAALGRALEAAGTARTWLMESRVRYALGCLQLGCERLGAARQHLEAAARAAEEHCDPDHLACIGRALRCQHAPPFPPSKLPSYLTHIDLDAEPGNGINQHLGNAAAGDPEE